MTQERDCIKSLGLSLNHMACFLRRVEHWQNGQMDVDLVYTTFHHLLALSYEQEAIVLGLESKEMHKFMCDFYGKDLI